MLHSDPLHCVELENVTQAKCPNATLCFHQGGVVKYTLQAHLIE